MTTPYDEITVAALLEEESAIRLNAVDERVCFSIGSLIARKAFDNELPVTVGVYLGDRLVYSASFPGTNEQNDVVIAAKRNVARLESHSSLYVRRRYIDAGTSFEEATGQQFPEYAPYGGAVPLRTTDGQVHGYVVVSGLTQEEDHQVAVDAILVMKAERA
jgi:uncharacterized protein (UPF0303 family)